MISSNQSQSWANWLLVKTVFHSVSLSPVVLTIPNHWILQIGQILVDCQIPAVPWERYTTEWNGYCTTCETDTVIVQQTMGRRNLVIYQCKSHIIQLHRPCKTNRNHRRLTIERKHIYWIQRNTWSDSHHRCSSSSSSSSWFHPRIALFTWNDVGINHQAAAPGNAI
jgi:hypothetical protein